jgi:hypothetical protein
MERSRSGPLTPQERMVVNRTAAGEEAIFPNIKPEIRAFVIRDLLFGRARLGFREPVGATLSGVRIRSATITGSLDLSDSARPFAGLPALELVDCDIEKDINMHAARLARLSLRGSRFGFLNLREAAIDGPLDISHCRGAEGKNCWIDGRGALINGDVLAEATKLRAPKKRPEEELELRDPRARSWPADAARRTALWLAGATIHGSVRLLDGFVACGGVSLDAARVQGDVRVYQARMTSIESDAFNARGANISGVLYLRYCRLIGTAWLLGLRTGGRFECSNTTICGYIDLWDVRLMRDKAPQRRDVGHEYRKALILADADIGASVHLEPHFTAHGQVIFAAAKVGGDFDATGALLHNHTSKGSARALDLTNAEIGASLLLDKIDSKGRLDLAGARISGKMSFRSARGDNKTENRKGQTLEAINVSVGGNADFGRLDDKGAVSCWRGAVNLTGSRISGDLIFSGARVENRDPEPPDQTKRILIDKTTGIAIIGRRVHVQGSILLDNCFRADGAVLLSGATIGRSLRCEGGKFCNPGRSALYAKDVEIGDDLILKRCVAIGHLRFDRARIDGSFVWERLILGLRMTSPPPQAVRQGGKSVRRAVRFDLKHARIGARLSCDPIKYKTPCRIDLTGARVSTVELLPNRSGWGTIDKDDLDYPIRMDGFVYDRIEILESRGCGCGRRRHVPSYGLREAAKVPRDLISDLWCPVPAADRTNRLLDLLLRYRQNVDLQFDDDRDSAEPTINQFQPQPFRHMARILRAEGHAEAARWIAIAEQWVTATERQFLANWLYWIYGRCFGFGLRPGLAFITLSLYIFFGTCGAWWLMKNHWMVETPLIATSSFVQDGERKFRTFVPAPDNVSPSNAKHDLDCHDLDDPRDAFVYAVDTVLPFIPLRQEGKCEIEPKFHWLRLGRATYAVIGWLVTSLALITWSGILRRFESDGE